MFRENKIMQARQEADKASFDRATPAKAFTARSPVKRG